MLFIFYLILIYFGLKKSFFSSSRETHAKAVGIFNIWKNGKLTKKKRNTTKWNVALTLFLYIKNDPFLHYLVMNENFRGVILDVLLCVLTKLVFLPSQNIQYSSISTVLTSCELFIVLWPIRHYQREVKYRRHIYPVLLHSEGQGHLTSLYYCYFYY